jgi:hypothetical protein
VRERANVQATEDCPHCIRQHVGVALRRCPATMR